MLRSAFHIAAFAVLCPVSSWAQDSGADAFAARDFALAQDLWQQEAAAGSAEAMLGLGLLADRGFGQTRDFDVAFEWYTQAATLGLAEAQFNIAIMYDAGLGRERDASAAQIWYTRAALRGHARAQYNLGLLFESGDGVAANPAFAAYWFAKSAEAVPAAADKDITPTDKAAELAAPAPSFGQVSGQQIELVWQSGALGAQSYLVEVLNAPEAGASYVSPVVSQVTNASGFLGSDIAFSNTAMWRISALSADAGDYAASEWDGAGSATPPRARVTLVVDPDVQGMAVAAAIFADDLQNAGYWVRLEDAETSAPDPVYVSYGYVSDLAAANVVANYLPFTPVAAPAQQTINQTQPGEIRVNLGAFRTE